MSMRFLVLLRAHQHWLPVALWMGVIFALSTDLGSAEHTSYIIRPLILWLVPTASPEAIGRIQFLIRKSAHLSEYAMLAFLVLRAIRMSGSPAPKPWSWQRAGLALLIAAAYAATDEWHQSFVPSRTADLGDVLIDSAGAAIGLLLVFLLCQLAVHRRFSREMHPR